MKHCVKISSSLISKIQSISEYKDVRESIGQYPYYCPETDMMFTERVAHLYTRISPEEFLNLDIVKEKLYKAFNDSLEN